MAQAFRLIPSAHEIQHVPLNGDEDFGTLGSFIQADNGYVWISSTKGVIVFDGHKSILYANGHPAFPLRSEPGLTQYADLRKDHRGNVYVCSTPDNRILKIDPQRRSIHQELLLKQVQNPSTLLYDVDKEGEVYGLMEDRDHDSFLLWTYTAFGEQNAPWRFSNSQYGVVRAFVVCESFFFLKTTKGIIRIHKNGYHLDYHPFPNTVEAICFFDRKQNAVYFLDPKTRTIWQWTSPQERPTSFAVLPAEVPDHIIRMHIDGSKVYALSGSHFFILDMHQQTYENLSEDFYQLKSVQLPGSLAEDIIDVGMVDDQLFILTTQHVFRLTDLPPPITKFREYIPVSNPNQEISMRGLAEDEHRNVYASFYTGVSKKSYPEQVFVSIPALRNMPLDQYSAYSLTYRAPYLFWHTLMIDLSRSQVKPYIPNSPRGHVTQVLVSDTLWSFVWYTHHLYRYSIPSGTLDSIPLWREQGTVTRYPLIINKMIYDPSDRTFWICTRMEGIHQISRQGEVLRSFDPSALGTNTEEGINDILLAGDMMWYGCYHGLGKINVRTNQRVMFTDPVMTTAGGRRSRIVYTIVPDETKGFFLGTQKGLTYFDTAAQVFHYLPPGHPLDQPEFNRTSGLKASDGRYYMGSTSGLFSFLPEELNMSTGSNSIRPVDLYSVSIFNGQNKKYRYLQPASANLHELKLDPSETNLLFRFSVPSFDQAVFYSYRLKGLDDEWSAFSADPTVLIHSLSPGHYTLEMKAAINAVDANASHYTLNILMRSYWYQKAWVWILLSLSVSALAVAWMRYVYHLKWRRQKALEALRIKISSDLHDDVGTLLAGVAMQSQMMSYDVPEKNKSSMLQLSEMSREAMERMRDTVWAMDARKDKYENLIDRMRDFAEKTLSRRDITHTFYTDQIDGKRFINPEWRQNLYLILKEALTNVVRHADARDVQIRFFQDDHHLHLQIHDDGTTPPAGPLAGQGIGNMKMRAEQIGGELTAVFNQGFKVDVTIRRTS